eukprot:TRINITY_DN80450_c0_g1_i1.p1 TRINITY_DN80450_c0_g1~~TRINITY_DN80450_c0_g1_i1.p1  ORF type:complete len:1395 (-),score=282.07 TRINITY_DN80450_c0_g1_i1:15-4199(-)
MAGMLDDDDEEIQQLLREQAAFERSGKPPAATVSRKAAGGSSTLTAKTSEDGRHSGSVGKSRPASLFKQQMQQGATRFAATHPELAALPMPEGAGSLPLKSCLSEVVERPASQDVKPVQRPAKAAAAETGFPVPPHRAVGKFLGAKLSPKQDDDDEPVGEPVNEEDAIDRENRQIIGSTSAEEIMEWQRQLMQQFGAGTCEFLKKRGQARDKQRADLRSELKAAASKAAGEGAAAKPEQSEDANASAAPRESAPTQKVFGVDLVFPGSDGSMKTPQDGGYSAGQSGESSKSLPDALHALGAGFLDRSEAQKLQWMTPAGPPDIDAVVTDESLPPEPAGKLVQLLRFDFEGRICHRSDGMPTAGPEDSLGLHHHGAESSQMGYTLNELLLLSRSSNGPQRALALRTIASIILMARIPLKPGSLSIDPALEKTGALGTEKLSRTGFGMGQAVFFWHAVARSDVPKFFAEALNDPSTAVQLAALYGAVALFDGIPLGDTAAKSGANYVGMLRKDAGDVTAWQAADAARCRFESTLCAPLDAARELVWPDAAPICATPLARRARVLVVTPESGGGGGAASWPPLLKRRLLSAAQDTEVTAADVLEPLLVAPPPPAGSPGEEAGAPRPPALLLTGVERCCAAVDNDETLLATAACTLSIASSWSPGFCYAALDHCDVPRRRQWLAAAGSTATSGGGGQLRLQALRLIRRSCQTGGRASADWWMAREKKRDTEDSDGDHKDWIATEGVRRAVLSIVAAQSLLKGDDPGSCVAMLCAVEGLRIWAAWVACGIPVWPGVWPEGMANYMSNFGVYLHRVAAQCPVEDAAGVYSWHWFIASQILNLCTEIWLRCEASDCAVLGTVVDAMGPLAATLGRGVKASSRAALQLCLSAASDLVLAAGQADEKLLAAGRTLLASLPQQGTELPPLAGPAEIDDQEAPWPLGGFASSERQQRLARLRSLTALCRLAAKYPDAHLVQWLKQFLGRAEAAVEKLAKLVPQGVAAGEAMVGPVQLDPWAALLAAAWNALDSCDEPADDKAAEQKSRKEQGELSASGHLTHALQVAGSWPTAREIFDRLDLLSITSGVGGDAVVRAAFRPAAPWTSVDDDIHSRVARQGGNFEAFSPILDSPLPLGPPILALASAPFFALLCSPPRDAAAALVEALASPSSAAVADATPPWLPFLSFVALLSTPLAEDDGWAFEDEHMRKHLGEYADVHLQKAPMWLDGCADWLKNVLRGLCERLAKTFLEQSFGDVLLARVLWCFSAPSMPAECRAVCWGVGDNIDSAVFLNLHRVLIRQPGEDGGNAPPRHATTLLWPLTTYLSTDTEEEKVLTTVCATLGLDAETPAATAAAAALSSWPAALALHQVSVMKGQTSALQAALGAPANTERPTESQDSMHTLD